MLRLARNSPMLAFAVAMVCLAGALAGAPTHPARAQSPPTCPDPTPTVVEVDAVPIVVESTTADYFVLYVSREVDGTDVDLPVLVKKGEAGTTTLEENIEALPAERYSVEKYLIADPADVDGDCIDDITELDDLGSQNPVNRASEVALTDGAVAIPDRATFETLSYQGSEVSGDTRLTDLEFIKFILVNMDTDRPTVYFMNTETRRVHLHFWDVVQFDVTEAMFGLIVYHPRVVAPDGSLGVYRFEFGTWDDYPFARVEYAYEVLAASMPLLYNNLAYYPMHARALPLYNTEKSQYDASRVNVLLEEDISPDLPFLSLNQGTGYGFLRVMGREERPNPREIVIYESLPNDLSRVAGIITTVPQTPLSHVNLRAVQDGIPNAYVRDAINDDTIDSLIDSHVQFTVTREGYTIRAATKAEVDAHYDASRQATTLTPERDLSVTEITALGEIGFDDWEAFGVKAANVAVLGTLGFTDGTVPDGFAVPFYFYDEFMKANDLYSEVSTMLAAPDFQTDYDIQEDMLKNLRDSIKDAVSPLWIIDALTAMHATYPDGQSLRYRSSTNNEDLPGFSGAGLYDSKTQDPDETLEDGIDKSIKGVWASLWNFRAFVERDFHRIDHLATAMGVLVHPNYSDELANGVAVSYYPLGDRDDVYYANTQIGEDLVTNPEALSVPEEILLLSGDSYEVLVYSNQVEAEQLIMSDAQIEQLRTHLTTIHDRFKVLYDPAADEPFAMEIEFKITVDDVLAIKQARPWVFRPSNEPPPPMPTPTPTPRPRPPTGGGGSSGSSGGGGGGGAPQNRSPEFSDSSMTDRSIAENTPAGADIGEPVVARDREDDTLTYSLRGTDAESFDIDPATGQLLTKAPLDYEAKAGYSVIVSVSDGKSSSGRDSDSRDDSITVTIDVENVDEPGAVALSSDQPQVAVALTATLTDLDGGLDVVVWLWERSADQADWTEIDGARTESYTPVIEDLSSYLRVTASYEDGHGRGKGAEAATGDPVLINTVPRFPDVDADGGITIEAEEGSGDAEAGGVGAPGCGRGPRRRYAHLLPQRGRRRFLRDRRVHGAAVEQCAPRLRDAGRLHGRRVGPRQPGLQRGPRHGRRRGGHGDHRRRQRGRAGDARFAVVPAAGRRRPRRPPDRPGRHRGGSRLEVGAFARRDSVVVLVEDHRRGRVVGLRAGGRRPELLPAGHGVLRGRPRAGQEQAGDLGRSRRGERRPGVPGRPRRCVREECGGEHGRGRGRGGAGGGNEPPRRRVALYARRRRRGPVRHRRGHGADQGRRRDGAGLRGGQERLRGGRHRQ